MAKCKCGIEMKTGKGCKYQMIRINGEFYERIPFGKEKENWGKGKCHDCYVTEGGIHHIGCDVERCPKCGGQLIGCDCSTEYAKRVDKDKPTTVTFSIRITNQTPINNSDMNINDISDEDIENAIHEKLQSYNIHESDVLVTKIEE